MAFDARLPDPQSAGLRARGTVTLAVSAATGATVSATFPVGRFTSAPRVYVSKQSDGMAKFIPYVRTITMSGCVIGIFAGDGLAATGSVPVAWEAVQD